MSRPVSTHRWRFFRNRISSPKHSDRSILRTKALSYVHSPGKMDSSPAGKQSYLKTIQCFTHSIPGWNSNEEFFKFTRGRFIVDETENLRRREIRFDLNQLAKAAADSVEAAQCVSIKKYPDGMFNKSFVLSMDDGREVVAKVPNPNAGIPHFTTASEVATMDFVSPSRIPSIPSLANGIYF